MERITREEVLENLGRFITTSNMNTARGGKASNQFELYYENGVAFQSYESIIAIKFGNYENIPEKLKGKIVLGSDYDYSKTTNKYRCAFLGEYMKETRQKLENGTYLFCEEF